MQMELVNLPGWRRRPAGVLLRIVGSSTGPLSGERAKQAPVTVVQLGGFARERWRAPCPDGGGLRRTGLMRLRWRNCSYAEIGQGRGKVSRGHGERPWACGLDYAGRAVLPQAEQLT